MCLLKPMMCIKNQSSYERFGLFQYEVLLFYDMKCVNMQFYCPASCVTELKQYKHPDLHEEI
ncbi:hypothetical protein HanIR_Chr10g0487211 [Helianthus annuus]|nr:hypothetical protein HanIR_Chr10g0487211 [Helianthus annuus]